MHKKNKTIYTKFLGSLIKKGNKIAAKNVLDNSFIQISKTNKYPAHLVLRKVFSKLNCYLEIKKIKIRKKIHFVPFPLTSARQDFLKIKWILDSAKQDSRKVNFSEKISTEISKIFLNKKSNTLLKKKYINKTALSNKSNIHYRW